MSNRWTFVRNLPFPGCYHFQYSGCGGNKNNFASENECKQMCGAGSSGVERDLGEWN